MKKASAALVVVVPYDSLGVSCQCQKPLGRSSASAYPASLALSSLQAAYCKGLAAQHCNFGSCLHAVLPPSSIARCQA